MKKEIKEEKETKKDYSIEEKDQRRLKGISKFIYVIAKILKVFTIIGIVGMFIAMIAVPIITGNLKVTKGEEESVISLFDNNIYYRRSDKKFELYDKNDSDNNVEVTNKKDVARINEVFDYLEENDLTLATIFIEVEFALLVVILFIQIKIFNKTHDLFKNIYDKDSPFVEENINILKEMGKLLIIALIVSIVMDIVSSFVISSTTRLGGISIVEILIVYVGLYIFKYGYNLQKDTKGKIYS